MFQHHEPSPPLQQRNDDNHPYLKLTFGDADLDASLDVRRAWILGSDTDCDLRIDDAQVDGQHAELYPVGTTWWVRDLGTDVGTFLNGEIFEAAPLMRPAEVQLGTDGPIVCLH